jgi:hypothetical protein
MDRGVLREADIIEKWLAEQQNEPIIVREISNIRGES